MWSEELNNKIKKVSESRIPEYDKSAWVKMEALLNKHLPLKKDNRRRFVYIFFLCFFITGGTLLLNNDWSKSKSERSLKPQNEKADEEDLKNESKNTFISKYPKAAENFYRNQADKKKETILSKTGRKNLVNPGSLQPAQNPSAVDKENMLAINGDKNKRQAHEKENEKNKSSYDNKLEDETELGVGNQKEKLITPAAIAQEQMLKDSLTDNPDAEKENEPALTNMNRKKLNNKSFLSRFSFSISAGPDVSKVGLNDPGKTKISYGAGMGYTISKRFSIRSGLYVADKIYSSGPEDYKPATGYWANVDLKEVYADCKVYEIPLALYYVFKEKKHHHLFAALGSSTYLMKKEAYHFLYKNQAGNLVGRDWTLKDKSKHYFSVITLSGGYAYRLNKTFSLMAEPYVKIPTGGVGYGRVKLKSAGIMFSLSATPF